MYLQGKIVWNEIVRKFIAVEPNVKYNIHKATSSARPHTVKGLLAVDLGCTRSDRATARERARQSLVSEHCVRYERVPRKKWATARERARRSLGDEHCVKVEYM